MLTSLTPSMLEVIRSCPSSMYRKMFSMAMMAFDMRSPAPKARPTRVIMLSVYPRKYIGIKVATIERGMLSAITSVGLRLLRKTRSMITARIAPNRASLTVEPTTWRVNLD